MDPIRVTDVPRLSPRPVDSHKGTFGRVLVVAGSRGMAGAAVLCGRAALRGGAGLVTVACPAAIQDVVAAGDPCYTTHGFTDPAELAALPATVIAVGPGLGRAGADVAAGLLRDAPLIPLVIDADGLAALPHAATKSRGGVIVTPHPGEFARMLGVSAREVQATREPLAVGFARAHRCVVLLKGHRTVVTDGGRVYANDTGNPGMATGGCGDVLTGLIAALAGQGFSPFDAAVLGAWVHGRAGDLAAAVLGQTAMTAADLLGYLPAVLREVEDAA